MDDRLAARETQMKFIWLALCGSITFNAPAQSFPERRSKAQVDRQTISVAASKARCAGKREEERYAQSQHRESRHALSRSRHESFEFIRSIGENVVTIVRSMLLAAAIFAASGATLAQCRNIRSRPFALSCPSCPEMLATRSAVCSGKRWLSA
jgi:hypothetical protein